MDLTRQAVPGRPPGGAGPRPRQRRSRRRAAASSPPTTSCPPAAKIAQSRRVTVRDALELARSWNGGLRRRRRPWRRPRALRGDWSSGRRRRAPAAAPSDRLRPNFLRMGAQVRGTGARVRSLHLPPRVRVSFSGVDGAGKSTQAALLVQNLGRAGLPARRSGLASATAAPRRSPARAPRAAGPSRAPPLCAAAARCRRLGQKATPMSRRGPLGWAWALAVTPDYLRILRREMSRADASAVVYDRGLADALVALEEEFGGAVNLGGPPAPGYPLGSARRGHGLPAVPGPAARVARRIVRRRRSSRRTPTAMTTWCRRSAGPW